MKKVLIPILLITLPSLVFSQNTINDPEKNIEITTIVIVSTHQQIESQITMITPSAINVTNISYKKSYDLVSIKAYRKSLQIRVKDIKIC